MACYLVTGGAGFIGSHLVDNLLLEGHSVRVIDDLSSGNAGNVPPAAAMMVGDIRNQSVLRAALDDVDGCFHLAAIASVAYYRNNWVQGNAVNLGGTITVFDEVRRAQLRYRRSIPIVYASSASVYGNICNVPVAEDAPTRPINGYGADKLSCELHAAVAASVHDISTVGLRFFNVYGPRQDPNSPYSGVISIFCERMSLARPITIHGDGRQVRDFIYVDDVVRAIRRAMDTACSVPQVFNVCTGIGTTISDLAGKIGHIHGIPPKIGYEPARAGDIGVSIGDQSLMLEKLRFSATVPLEAGLRRIIPAERKNGDRRAVAGGLMTMSGQ